MTLIAVVSDTHGMLRPEVLALLRDAQPSQILHAGDVCSDTILKDLAAIAPVTGVRGNCDYYGAGQWLMRSQVIEVESHSVYMTHDLNLLDLDPKAAEFDVVITGHTHQPKIFDRDGVLYLNPGSIGSRRFDYPISFAWLTLSPDAPPSAKIEYLDL